MVECRPRNRDEMRLITGVGEKKLDLYGADFLNIIRVHGEEAKEPASDTIAETVKLFHKEMDVERVAVLRSLKPETVYSHLARAVEDGDVELEQIVNLKEREIQAIKDALLKQPEETKALKPVYEALEGVYDYGILRCVRAALLRGP
jgi:ATP-dependent DNA helicase RecQ